jgi:hypothetical protein
MVAEHRVRAVAVRPVHGLGGRFSCINYGQMQPTGALLAAAGARQEAHEGAGRAAESGLRHGERVAALAHASLSQVIVVHAALLLAAHRTRHRQRQQPGLRQRLDERELGDVVVDRRLAGQRRLLVEVVVVHAEAVAEVEAEDVHLGGGGWSVAEQGYLAPLEHGAGSSCRRLYALMLMFPPKLSSHTCAHCCSASQMPKKPPVGSESTLDDTYVEKPGSNAKILQQRGGGAGAHQEPAKRAGWGSKRARERGLPATPISS